MILWDFVTEHYTGSNKVTVAGAEAVPGLLTSPHHQCTPVLPPPVRAFLCLRLSLALDTVVLHKQAGSARELTHPGQSSASG